MAEPQTPRSSFPSREQYDAAAQKVIATAPAGLSQDEFDALVDKTIEQTIATPSAQSKPAAEQPSGWGFVRNATSDALRTGMSIAKTGSQALDDPISAIKALPAGIMSRIHHYQADIDPGAAWEQLKHGRIGAAAGNMLPVGEFYKRPVQSATDIYAGAQIGKLGTSMAKAGARRMPGAGMGQAAVDEAGVAAKPPAAPSTRPTPKGPTTPPVPSGGTPRFGAARPTAPPPADSPVSAQPPHEFEANGMDMGKAGSQPIKEGEIAGGVDDAMYQEILRKLGGRGEAEMGGTAPAAPADMERTPASGEGVVVQDLPDNVTPFRAKGFDEMAQSYDDQIVTRGGQESRDMMPDIEAEIEKALQAQRESDRMNAGHAAWSRGPEIPNASTQWPDPTAPPELADDIIGEQRNNERIQSDWDQQDHTPGPRFSDSMRSTEPPAEHMFGDMDRALASRDELDQASALHRGGAEMDARYDHLTDPESSGAVTDPAALMAKLFWQVLKDHVKEAAGREWSPGFVGQTGRYGTMVGKKLPATGAIMNLNRPEER